MTSSEKIILAMVAAGAGLVGLAMLNRPKGSEDVQIDPDMGTHRGLAPTYGYAVMETRLPSQQDPKGGMADYLGYPYDSTTPSRYAKGEPAQHIGSFYDKREDNWNFVPPAPIDYGAPPLRIPRLWKDANRFWDGINSQGGTDMVAQKIHLFHLRPSAPTRGYRSVSGMLAPVGGGMSTASRARIPAIFVPSVVG